VLYLAGLKVDVMFRVVVIQQLFPVPAVLYRFSSVRDCLPSSADCIDDVEMSPVTDSWVQRGLLGSRRQYAKCLIADFWV